jgi:hypothetical protein
MSEQPRLSRSPEPGASDLDDAASARTPVVFVLLVCAALVSLDLVIYWQTLGFDVVDLDDGRYVAHYNQHVPNGLTIEGVRWAFTTMDVANWHPLTWLSLMLDRTLVQDGWGVFHATNVLLHTINTLLLLGAMTYMTRLFWPSAVVAAIFAVHPLHVESVAWISERKDVLSTMFWLLTMWAYALHVRRGHRQKWMTIATLLLALGLMAKPMLVTLPFALLLLDFWPLRREGLSLDDLQRDGVSRWLGQWWGLALEKLPMLGIVVASCIITWLAQRGSGAVEHAPLRWRLANAVISYVRYLGMAGWPEGLAAHYPRPGTYGLPPWPTWIAGVCAAGLVCVTIALLATARRAPWAIVGWLWFLGTLVPTIGVIQVGSQAMADRYMYVPLIGLSIIPAWSLWRLSRAVAPLRCPLALIACAAVVGLAMVARQQAAHWRDSDALFQHMIAVTSENYHAHALYGQHLMARRRFADAERQFTQCVALGPQFAQSHALLGRSLTAMQRLSEAEIAFNRALAIDPAHAPAHFGLAQASLLRDDSATAMRHLLDAVRLDPDNSEYQAALRELGAGGL